jgi:hypothetical protein
LRVVERVEREMLNAEWESWVWSEAIKCKQTAAVLKKNAGEGEMVGLKKWFDGYCGSCLGHIDELNGS